MASYRRSHSFAFSFRVFFSDGCGFEEGFVGVHVSYAGDDCLIAQQRLHRDIVLTQQLLQSVNAER